MLPSNHLTCLNNNYTIVLLASSLTNKSNASSSERLLTTTNKSSRTLRPLHIDVNSINDATDSNSTNSRCIVRRYRVVLHHS